MPKPKVQNSRTSVVAALPETLVSLKGVGLRYRMLSEQQTTIKGRILGAITGKRAATKEFWVLRNLDTELRAGEIVGIIGPNGAGKSSLLRLIAGVIPPAEGTVQTRGVLTPMLDLTGPLNFELTGRANCFLWGSLLRVPNSEMEAHLPEIQDFAELGEFFDVPVKYYSSGMVSRLGFSIATQFNPDILLLDEVLSVGDEQFQKKSFFRMSKILKQGRLVVMVSHSMQFIEETCTRAILLGNNGILADGTPADVIVEYRERVEGRR